MQCLCLQPADPVNPDDLAIGNTMRAIIGSEAFFGFTQQANGPLFALVTTDLAKQLLGMRLPGVKSIVDQPDVIIQFNAVMADQAPKEVHQKVVDVVEAAGPVLRHSTLGDDLHSFVMALTSLNVLLARPRPAEVESWSHFYVTFDSPIVESSVSPRSPTGVVTPAPTDRDVKVASELVLSDPGEGSDEEGNLLRFSHNNTHHNDFSQIGGRSRNVSKTP